MKSNNEKIKIDGIDKKILRFFDGTMPESLFSKLPEKLEFRVLLFISGLRKLEASGLIAGSKFIINPKVLGYTTMAYIGIYLDKAMSNPLAVKELEKIPEVLECHYTTGNWSIL